MIARAKFLAALLVATGGRDEGDDAPAVPAAATIRVRTRDGTIVTPDLETYLRGVVPLESPAGWPAAALQAQAIVARTYALARRTSGRAFDVEAGDADQQYGGPAAERGTTSAAVDATRGLVLRFRGGPVTVFYSACCGGHTADAAGIWGGADLPYLHGVPDAGFCAAAPDYRWRRTVTVEAARASLTGLVRGRPAGFELVDAGATGRPRSVLVRDESGAVATLSVADFRRRFGTAIVRSLWLRRISVETTQAVPLVVIEGAGRGHGVGLCQWGARGRAAGGSDALGILAQYFPGTEVSGV